MEESISLLNSAHDLTWLAKRSLSPIVSNSDVDVIYDEARAAGAIGGKLIGAGGGGFLLLFVAPERQQAVRETLSTLIHVPFKFEFAGSQIIFFNREEDYLVEEQVRARQTVRAFRELKQ